MRKSLSLKLAMGVLGMGLAAAPSFAEVKVSDALSLSGFVDMSAGYTDDNGTTSAFAALDQFELDFKYKFADNLTAQVDLNAWPTQPGAPRNDGVVLEQAFLTYTMGPASLTAGKFLSSTGFEAAEPTGLYQYTWSNTLVYGGYQNGIAASYTITPMVSVYGAFLGSVWDGTDTDIESPGYEAQISLTPLEGLTAKAAYAAEMDLVQDDGGDTGVTVTSDQSLINVWASYAAGPALVAAEVNILADWGPADEAGLGYLVMANYKLTDKFAVTARYSSLKMDGGTADPEVTLSPSYAISPSWLVLAEVKRELEDKITALAVESLLMF
jgi:hypothetical protein